MEWLFRKAEEFLQRHRWIRRWRKVLAVLMVMVVFISTYAMVLPAITLETGEGTEIGLFADTPADESTLTDSVPEAEAEGTALTAETVTPAEETPAEPAPAEPAPAEETPAETAPTETIPADEVTPAPSAEDFSTVPEEAENPDNDEPISENSSVEQPADEEPADDAVKSLVTGGLDYTVTMTFTADAKIPDGAVLSAKEILPTAYNYEGYFNKATDALNLSEEQKNNTYARFFDIKILLGAEEVTPEAPVQVEITYSKPQENSANAEMNAVHFGNEGPEVIAAEATQADEMTGEVNAVGFEAGAFSVYGVVYTVDFHYEVNGQVYEFGMPGGGFLSFYSIIESLGVANCDADSRSGGENPEMKDSDTAISEETRKFTANVASVEFSSPELVWVGKVNEETTVGALKEANGLEVLSSADLTEEQKGEINGSTVEAGDWALISVQPFESEETLTVTMKDGEVFTVRVTDEQISKQFISASGEYYDVTVTYGEGAGIPENSELHVTEFGYESAEYRAAYDKVVAYKKTVDADFSEAGMGFEALDISIIDPDGNNVEPAAPVQVSIKRNALPENADEETFIETAEVQHIVESGTVSRVDVVANTADTEAGFITVSDGTALAEFTVDSFSTYTISWGGGQSVATPSYLYATSANTSAWYFDDDGNSVGTRSVNTNNLYIMGTNRLPVPNGVIRSNNGTIATADLYLVYTRTTASPTAQEATEANSTFHIYFRRNNNDNSRFADVTVHYVDDSGKRINRTQGQNVTFTGTSYDTGSIFGNYMGNIPGYANPRIEYRGPEASPKVVTVHYGYMNGNTFVEFDNLPEGAQTSYGGPTQIGDQLNVRYDFEGKDYVTTRINDPADGTQISPLLQTEADSASYWKYRVQSTTSVNGGINAWQKFGDNENDIYVIYRDTPTEKSYDDHDLKPEDLAAPATNKDVRNNDNGTYDIELSVTGTSNSMTNKTHANVVIVLDTSSSMDYKNIETTGQTIPDGKSRLNVAKEAIGYLADQLFGFNSTEDPAAIEVAFVNFSHRVRNELTMQNIYSGTDASAFKAMINATNGNGGTNYDTAIEAANSILWGDADPVYVVFVTDGDTVSRGYLEYDESGARDHASDWDGGTYYTADTATYGDTYLERARSAAKLQVDKILADSNNKFYSIGVFGNVQYLPGLGGTYLGQANEQSKIEEAFSKIIGEIALDLGYKDVTIHDGITAMTSTTLVNGVADQFRYEITLKDGTKKEYANGAALRADYPGIGLAEYDSGEKAVKWDLGETYQLSDGVTYKVIFTVWPSQEAYDLLAELNNGTKDYDTLPTEVHSQIVVEKGKYYLKTNTYSTIDYTSVKTQDGVVVETNTVTGAEIKDPKGKMILDGTSLQMKKEWNDSLDPVQLLELLTSYLNEDKTDTTYEVVLRLWQDKNTSSEKEIATETYPAPNGFIYKPEVTITEGEVTSSTWPVVDVSIAPGVLVTITEENSAYYDPARYPRITYGSVTYAMLETGHNYTITEDDTDLHFELNTDIYHPMVVDGKLKTVKFSSDGRSITEMTPDNTELSTLTATNDLKGGLEIRKYVTTKDDKSDKVTSDMTFFTFKIKLQKSAADDTPVYTTPEQFNLDGSTILGSLGFRIFASAVIPEEATNVAEDKSSYEYNGNIFRANYNSSNEITGYTARGTIPSSGELTLKIRQSDTIRVVNLPAGTYHTVEEAASAGYELIDQNNASGAVPANSQSLAEFWNKRTSFNIDLLKVDELDEDKVLAGAEFTLFKEDGSTPATDAEGKTIGTIKTGTDGKAQIGSLPLGTYKLVETVSPEGYNLMTSPIIIVVGKEKVSFQQGSKQPMDAEKSGDGSTWTITATNNPGVVLPDTGGPGTAFFYIIGAILVLGGSLLMFAKRGGWKPAGGTD